MATTGAIMKSRRRPATYGKATRKGPFGLRSPIPSESHETGHHSKHEGEGIVDFHRHSPTEADSTGVSIHVSQEIVKPTPPATDETLYDVPVSDEDRPPNQRLRPITKRRKIRKKGDDRIATMKPQGVGGFGRLDSLKHTSEPPLQKKLPIPKPLDPMTAGRRLQVPENPTIYKTLGEPRDTLNPYIAPSITQGGASIISSDEKACSGPDHKPSANALSLDQNVLEIVERNKKQKKKKKHEKLNEYEDNDMPSLNLQNKYSGNASEMSIRANFKTGRLKTPEAERKELYPDLITFMSPGGLGFPNLKISSSIEDHDSLHLHNQDTYRNNIHGFPSKGKLKDRLVAKDGLRRQESPSSLSDAGSSIDESMDMERLSAPSESEPIERLQTVQLSTADSTSQPNTISLTHGGPKVTYAARQRTLRSEEDQDDVLSSLSMAGDIESEKSARRIRVRPFGGDETHHAATDPQTHDGDTTASLRSIHELREAGVNARLFGETQNLLEDIGSSDTFTKRSGLLDLSTRLDQPAFRAQVLAHGLESRLLAHVQLSDDPVVNVFLAVAMLKIISAPVPRHVLEQYRNDLVIEYLSKLLNEIDSVREIIRSRKSNTTKAFRKEAEAVSHNMSQSDIWRYGRPIQITPRSISLQCLEYLVRQLREAGFKDRILSQTLTERLLTILSGTTTNSDRGSAILRNEIDIQLTLSILESSTLSLGASGYPDNNLWGTQFLETMALFLALSSDWQKENQGQIWTLTLRLCLNITNNNIQACKIFSSSMVIERILAIVELNFGRVSTEKEDEYRALMVDNLILSFGFLINLAERSEESRKLFLANSPNARRPLDTLLHLFTTRWIRAFEVTSEEELRISVPLGYLAVLLTFLSVDFSLRTTIASQLEGGTLKHLLVAVDEFLNYNRKVAEESHAADEESDAKTLFTGRLQAVVDKLKGQQASA